MAPGVIQNSESVNHLESRGHNTQLINELLGEESNKACPIDHFNINGSANVHKIVIKRLEKKAPPRVTRPKVLKNHESANYLYDRLYNDTCPRVVSSVHSVLNPIQ